VSGVVSLFHLDQHHLQASPPIGFQASYGVFLKFYKTNSNFGDNPFLPFVGLLSIVSPPLNKSQHHQAT